MKALRFDGDTLGVEEISRPEINGEALVRVVKSGICNTDLEIARGYAGFSGTLGHEFVGVVESGADRPEIVGKRVVGEINAGCGFCEVCRSGDSRHCPTRTVLGIVGRDGAHAEFLKLPSRNLVEVPPNVSDEAAVFVEPLAAANGITERLSILPEASVALIGDGKLGLLCARSLKLHSSDVSLFGKHRAKLELAEKSGVNTYFANEAAKFHASFDVVVEASGSESGFASALDLVKPRGTIVLKSTFHGLPTWEASRVVVNEVTIVGSRCGRFAPALAALSSNQIEVLDLISEEFPLADGVRAIERAGAAGVLKIQLRMD